MPMVKFSWDAQLIGIRRDVCPRARWEKTSRVWAMTESEAETFLQAAQARMDFAQMHGHRGRYRLGPGICQGYAIPARRRARQVSCNKRILGRTVGSDRIAVSEPGAGRRGQVRPSQDAAWEARPLFPRQLFRGEVLSGACKDEGGQPAR
jgi:hypothetical protein